jgi:hypothetical protein
VSLCLIFVAGGLWVTRHFVFAVERRSNLCDSSEFPQTQQSVDGLNRNVLVTPKIRYHRIFARHEWFLRQDVAGLALMI